MEYYYGQAWVMGKFMDIRVKPEMIEGELVKEIELYLPRYYKFHQTREWHTKRSVQDTPECSEIWVEVDGMRKFLKFRES